MTTKTKQFDVVAISPVNNRETTFRSVSADNVNISTEGITFNFNNFYPTVPVISMVEVSQDLLDAQLAYFKKNGTANE
tara:strand:- start:663 stop:896 length:234 start_codon:yes stop_codon:yes gene_type:complete